jgi:hypothetical protein
MHRLDSRLWLSSVALVAAITACTPSQIGGDDSPAPDAADITNPPPQDCPDVSFTTTPVVPSISLLIDRSGSMNNGIGNTTRYNAIRDALVGPTGVVTNLQDKVYFGASLYSTDAPCPKLYTVPRARDNKQAIETLINSQSPGGNTPTAGSIDQAVAAFAADPAPPGSPPIIVLATDGLPNSCNGDDGQAQSVAAAGASYAAGIRLFMLGVGGGINDQHLQAMANAGAGVQAGQPNAQYYLANTPADLKTAFDQIIVGVTSCELTINGTIDEAQAASGTVTLNGAPLSYPADWELVNGNIIRLKGGACDTLKGTPGSTVEASFPCGAVLL